MKLLMENWNKHIQEATEKDIGRVAAILNKIPEQEDKIFQYAIKMYSVFDSVVSESRKYKLKIIKG